MTTQRIAIVAHGRFHAFDLARELGRLGHAVTLLTNYPAWVVTRFGLDPDTCRGNWQHGVVERGVRRVAPGQLRRTEAARHRWFGRWAARELERGRWDIIHTWSGVSEELLESPALRGAQRVLMRGSAHILEQAVLLGEETGRLGGVEIDRPSTWMIEREQREYALADHILVLSEFARASFERQGIGADRVSVLPLGVDVAEFRPTPGQLAARVDRLLAGEPLRVLYVGALSARKGLADLLDTARLCAPLPIEFTLVGARMPEAHALLTRAGRNVVERGSVNQRELPAVYREADVFMFPTVEDGFGMVLTQAAAAGLPVLCTPNCAGPDLLAAGAPGWLVPIRRPEAFAERLTWCHQHRSELVSLITVAASDLTRTWREVASDFIEQATGWTATGPMAGREARGA